MSFPIVLVEWEDTFGSNDDGWEVLDEVIQHQASIRTCTTIGYKVHENDYGVLVSGTWDPQAKMVNGWSYIPKKQIVKMEVLNASK